MATKTKAAFLACSSLVLFVPQLSAASIIVTEIMYDVPGSDSGHEWIEIYNDGEKEVSIAKWRLFEADTKHKITNVVGGDTLLPHAFAVIAANAEIFRTESYFSGQLFDSAFSLSSSGEILTLLDASSTIVSSASYGGSLGAAGDGNSLNRTSATDSFVARKPTPGASMAGSAIPPAEKQGGAASTKSTTKSGRSASPTENSNEEEEFPTRSSSEDRENSQSLDRIAVGEVQTATATVFSASSALWWVAALLVSAAAGSVLLYSRSIQKKEWNIIEEQ